MEQLNSPFRLSSQQLRIYERLSRLVGPSAAAFYKDACRIMEMNPPFETASHFVSHSLREIESSLQYVLLPISRALQVPSSKSEDESHANKIRRIMADFHDETGQLTSFWIGLSGRENADALHKRAHRNSLSKPRPFDSDFRTFWEEMQLFLDRILDLFEARYSEIFVNLEKLINTTDQLDNTLKTIMNKIPQTEVTLRYLFSKLDGPSWIKPLAEKRFFADPPAIIQVAQNGFQFPGWPALDYLGRMAGAAPDEVTDIICAIPETNNSRIYGNIAEIGVKLPPNQAKRVAHYLAEQLDKTKYILLPSVIGELVSSLAKEKESAAALELARVLLGLPFSNATSEPFTVRMEAWAYENVLENIISNLTTADSIGSFKLLCEALMGDLPREPNSALNDSSWWRPAVEDNAQNWHTHEISNALITGIRNIAEQSGQRNPTTLLEIIHALKAHEKPVFQRIVLHLLRILPDANPHLIRLFLTDKTLFDEIEVYHEYALLLHARAGLLLSEQLQKIEQWILMGPVDVTEEGLSTPDPAFEEARERRRKIWQLRRLSLLEDVLTADAQAYLGELIATYGRMTGDEREYAQFFSTGGGWRGQSSSFGQLPDLSQLSVPEIVDLLVASSSTTALDDAGLSLKTAVSRDPSRFEPVLGDIQTRAPGYVGAVLRGFEAALRETDLLIRDKILPLNWDSILPLCFWAVTQSEGVGTIEEGHLVRSSMWQEVRSAAADLLLTALEQNPVPIPVALSATVLACIKPLTDDLDPLPEIASIDTPTTMKPFEASLNTIRGKAMLALLQFAYWVREQSQVISEKTATTPFVLSDIPEIQDVLESHLDVAHEKSHAIRAVYGRHFSGLVWLDEAWASNHVSRIFPHDNIPFYNAAWATFLSFNHPGPVTFRVIADEYAWSVAHIDDLPAQAYLGHTPQEYLGRHILTLYWHGYISLDEPDNLVSHFFAVATPALRSHSLAFIGHSLVNAAKPRKEGDGEIPLPPEVAQRLITLWEWRVKGLQNVARDVRIAELKAFGWWFGSGLLNPVWMLVQLRSILSESSDIDILHLVMEQLVALTAGCPTQVVECLNDFVIHVNELWHIEAEIKNIRAILEMAVNSSDPSVQIKGREVISRLISRGFLTFKELLINPTPPQ